jgi:hypothetical protein
MNAYSMNTGGEDTDPISPKIDFLEFDHNEFEESFAVITLGIFIPSYFSFIYSFPALCAYVPPLPSNHIRRRARPLYHIPITACDAPKLRGEKSSAALGHSRYGRNMKALKRRSHDQGHEPQTDQAQKP